MDLQKAFDHVKDAIPQDLPPTVRAFIAANSGWNDEAAALAECEWELVKPLFDGLRREKFNLGKATLDFYDEREADLLTSDERDEELAHPFYPEIVLGWQTTRPEVLSLTDYQLDCSLHEAPVISNEGFDDTNESPAETSSLIGDLTKRYLDLDSHERANLSVVYTTAILRGRRMPSWTRWLSCTRMMKTCDARSFCVIATAAASYVSCTRRSPNLPTPMSIPS